LKIAPKEEFFEPTDSHQIVIRSLRNLAFAFEKLGEAEKVLEIQELLQILES